MLACPVDCVGAWGAWGACSKTCGTGTQARAFAVTTIVADGGVVCEFANAATALRDCSTAACPASCIGEWGAWGGCSVTCGNGTLTRSYVVSNAAAVDGVACTFVDGATETSACAVSYYSPCTDNNAADAAVAGGAASAVGVVCLAVAAAAAAVLLRRRQSKKKFKLLNEEDQVDDSACLSLIGGSNGDGDGMGLVLQQTSVGKNSTSSDQQGAEPKNATLTAFLPSDDEAVRLAIAMEELLAQDDPSSASSSSQCWATVQEVVVLLQRFRSCGACVSVSSGVRACSGLGSPVSASDDDAIRDGSGSASVFDVDCSLPPRAAAVPASVVAADKLVRKALAEQKLLLQQAVDRSDGEQIVFYAERTKLLGSVANKTAEGGGAVEDSESPMECVAPGLMLRKVCCRVLLAA